MRTRPERPKRSQKESAISCFESLEDALTHLTEMSARELEKDPGIADTPMENVQQLTTLYQQVDEVKNRVTGIFAAVFKISAKDLGLER